MKRKPEEIPADEAGDAPAQPAGARAEGEAQGAPGAPLPPAEQLAAELADARKLAQQLKHQSLELAADLDNQAKRFAREMIEVLDNLDSVVRSLTDAERASPLGHGVELTQVVFLEKLKSFGIEPIDAVGQPFDPRWHEAILEAPRDDVPAGTVTTELTRGYRLGGKLVRAAKVEVAKATAAGDAEEDGS